MDFWQGFVVLTVAHLLAAASPDPDFAYVTRRSLVKGRRAGLYASLGIALGLSIHIVYSAASLAAVIAHSAHWMTAIRIAGGAYLIWLGVQGLRSSARSSESAVASPGATPASPWRQIAGGFLCNALNPKAPIYFLALCTAGLSPDLPASTLVAYGAWIVMPQWLWFSLVATVFTHRAVRERLLGMRHWIDRALGAALIALGIRVLLSSK